MFRRALAAALAATALTGTASAQKAGNGQLCPDFAPCCGLYNDCGVGAFCVQGCDPVHSHSLGACVPNPQCKGGNYKLNSLSDVQTIDKYLGDASKINWVSQGRPVLYEDSILLTMAEGTVGTLLSSTHYVWYGKICAKMTTSQGKGVVTAFIMMSDAKDEIDFEWVGVDTENAQSNYYALGVTDYTNGRNLSVSNTVNNVHEYCIDWKPEELKWLIDGNEMRSVKRSDTWNETSKRFDYPQTPSRVMLSLWPAGLPSNEKGTIEWAGGEIDWNSPYMQNGYYYAMVQSVSVECYKPPSGAKGNGDKSYIYTDRSGTEGSVERSNKQVILGSLYATGEDPQEGAETASTASRPTQSVNLVPGGNPGGGGRGEGVQTSGIGSPTGGAGNPDQAQPTDNSDGTGNNDRGFNQGNGFGGQGAGSSLQPGLGKVGGGAVAIVVAILGLMVL
ncbi:glycoside hydrolase family 16 protein [Sporormia fimetaria CBS 119925]|uniref:Glycoside hydrolase family 16 protein n=1 Tax=Sporormia fimetaria CBS 119925 TaxID=1340428 RepID=A0A6A6VGD1_9PLEO|nr:glycoside hydrolase family 16 protein [Sporormia fimetaria CBS 119925]